MKMYVKTSLIGQQLNWDFFAESDDSFWNQKDYFLDNVHCRPDTLLSLICIMNIFSIVSLSLDNL